MGNIFGEELSKPIIVLQAKNKEVILKQEFEVVRKIRPNSGFGWDALKGVPVSGRFAPIGEFESEAELDEALQLSLRERSLANIDENEQCDGSQGEQVSSIDGIAHAGSSW
ncbi:hypothetical protein HOY82DRAFT_539557 [Tuber indicum]|nr:hypothetical protein HOY82DRAFT_539557 [Tuber indicum]